MKRVAMTTEQYEMVKVRDQFRCARCGGGAMNGEWHHRRGKAVRDAHTHCSCNGVFLCPPCHQGTHAQPLLARNDGFIVSRVSAAMPEEVAVKHGIYGWVKLTCTGSFEPVPSPV